MSRKRYDDIYEAVAKELGYPKEVVRLVYNSSWKFARDKIIKLDLSEAESQQDLIDMRASFYFPNLGKLYPSYKNLAKMRRLWAWEKDNLKKKDAKDKED